MREPREPELLPHDESPFALDVSAAERRRRMQALDADIIGDEFGMIVAFRGEDDVDALLNDVRFGAFAMPTLQLSGVTDGPLFDMWSLLMFGKDGEEHKRIRATVAREFTPKAVEHYRPDVERAADALVSQMAGEVELWSAFAVPLAARAACRVVGIPERDSDQAAIWALDLVHAFFFMNDDQRARVEKSTVEFTAYLDDHLAAKRATPSDDVTSKLVARDANHDLTTDEVRALIANLVFGGLEATAKALTTGVFNLLVHDQWTALAEHPNHVEHAVVELLRFSPPSGVGRYVREDGDFEGVALRAGQMVVLDVEAACHDARRYENPETLDIARPAGRQLTFGAGAHFCLGANLAKLVLGVALRTLTDRFPTMTLAGDVEWDYETFHGIVNLPVRV
jgi:cytochrome P450